MKEAIDNKELVIALEELEKEKGIKKEYLVLGEKLKINMSNFDSLNVASAAAIFLYKYSQN